MPQSETVGRLKTRLRNDESFSTFRTCDWPWRPKKPATLSVWKRCSDGTFRGKVKKTFAHVNGITCGDIGSEQRTSTGFLFQAQRR
jgi:hypothetical protein